MQSVSPILGESAIPLSQGQSSLEALKRSIPRLRQQVPEPSLSSMNAHIHQLIAETLSEIGFHYGARSTVLFIGITGGSRESVRLRLGCGKLGYGKDVITDFDADGGEGHQDFIDADYGDVLSVHKVGKHDTLIDFGDGDTLTLRDIRPGHIDATDFI